MSFIPRVNGILADGNAPKKSFQFRIIRNKHTHTCGQFCWWGPRPAAGIPWHTRLPAPCHWAQGVKGQRSGSPANPQLVQVSKEEKIDINVLPKAIIINQGSFTYGHFNIMKNIILLPNS